MATVPSEAALDSTPALMREGYLFIPRRCRKYHADVFEARLMLQKTLFMSGPEAAALFYDRSKFKREGAAPRRLKKTLFGEGGVQGLDGEAHRKRKALFVELVSHEQVRTLVSVTRAHWLSRLSHWQRADQIILLDEMHEIICRGVCEWAGVPLPEQDVAQRTQDIVLLFETPSAVGIRYWQGRRARHRAEKWAAGLIERVRKQELDVNDQTALYRVAWHRDHDGTQLGSGTAAVELLNILRPTVAVGRFIVFAALALHQHPVCRHALIGEESDTYRPWFVEEVRRFYPFFPSVMARVKEDFEWKGVAFPKGRRVVLDLYGTNHDGRAWTNPDEFDPERFRGWEDDGFSLIPQGGGELSNNHRCPGERIAVGLMNMAVQMLVGSLRYEVPDQDLSINFAEMPALPKSGFVIANVKQQ